MVLMPKLSMKIDVKEPRRAGFLKCFYIRAHWCDFKVIHAHTAADTHLPTERNRVVSALELSQRQRSPII